MRINELRLYASPLNESMRYCIKKQKIGLRFDGVMLSCSERSFRGSGINHDDLRFMTVPANSLPEDGMGDAKIGANQNNDIRFFEVLVSVRRSIEAEGLFIGGNVPRHAFTGVAIPVKHAHPELCQCASDPHFFTNLFTNSDDNHHLLPLFSP